MRKLVRILESISDNAGHFSGWLVLAMIVLILIEVFMRYVLHQPLMIADEISAYMLVAMTYLAAGYAFSQGQHIRITAFVTRLPAGVASRLRVVTLGIALISSIVLALSSYDFIEFSFRLGLKSATWLRAPLQMPHLTLAIGFTILSLLLVAELVKAIIKVKSGITFEGKEH